MKSTIYEEQFGAARTGPPDYSPDPDTVEEILVEVPLTLELNERMFTIARSRVVGANAKWVYTYYLLTGHYSNEKLSLRATARALNMPWETFRRARRELEQASVIIPIVTGIRGSQHRLLVRDIREVAQNEPSPAQNEPVAKVAQNEPVRLARVSRGDTVKVLISSKNRYKYDRVTTKDTNKETLSEVGHDDLDEAFGTDPPPLIARASAPSRPFKLKPPPGPQNEPRSPRAKGQKVPWQLYPRMFEVCYGATTSTQQYALGQVIRGRIGRAIQNLISLGADLNRLGEFLTWWRTWAKSRPSPENVVTHWLNAMEQIDHELHMKAKGAEKLEDVTEDEYAKIVAGLKERTQREMVGVAQ